MRKRKRCIVHLEKSNFCQNISENYLLVSHVLPLAGCHFIDFTAKTLFIFFFSKTYCVYYFCFLLFLKNCNPSLNHNSVCARQRLMEPSVKVVNSF